MPGSTPLVDRASSVQQLFDSDLEDQLLHDLQSLRDGSPDDSLRLGYTIVFESELVMNLAARLGSARWTEVATVAPHAGNPAAAVTSALRLLGTLLGQGQAGDAEPNDLALAKSALQSLLRQVRARCSCRCMDRRVPGW